MTAAKHKMQLYMFILLFMLTACSSTRQPNGPAPSKEETVELLNYLEENGNLLNSPYLPSLVNAGNLYHSLHGANIQIIDLRPADEFAASHIEHSVNVRPSGILNHFEQVIDPGSFDFIVLVCPNAMLSAYVNSVLLLLGYDNVLTLRFGLSSWDHGIAEGHWLAALSSHLEGKLETQPIPKPPAGELPAIGTGETNGYRILRARATKILNARLDEINVSLEEVTDDPEKYFLINYWPEVLYNSGHLPGAIQYTPKTSLHTTQHLKTLPADQPIAIYCFTGHHSAYVTSFLRLLGYDAYNLPYGANSFIHNTMYTTQGGFRAFTEESVHHFPLVGKGSADRRPELETDETEEGVPVIGGC